MPTGTLHTSSSVHKDVQGREILRKIVLSWTCTALGAVSALVYDNDADDDISPSELAGFRSADIQPDGRIVGCIVKMETIPDADDAPSANYDIQIHNDLGFDVLGGAGANRHTSDNEAAVPTAAYVCSRLTVVVANAGASKKGKIVLYVSPV